MDNTLSKIIYIEIIKLSLVSLIDFSKKYLYVPYLVSIYYVVRRDNNEHGTF